MIESGQDQLQKHRTTKERKIQVRSGCWWHVNYTPGLPCTESIEVKSGDFSEIEAQKNWQAPETTWQLPGGPGTGQAQAQAFKNWGTWPRGRAKDDCLSGNLFSRGTTDNSASTPPLSTSKAGYSTFTTFPSPRSKPDTTRELQSSEPAAIPSASAYHRQYRRRQKLQGAWNHTQDGHECANPLPHHSLLLAKTLMLTRVFHRSRPRKWYACCNDRFAWKSRSELISHGAATMMKDEQGRPFIIVRE